MVNSHSPSGHYTVGLEVYPTKTQALLRGGQTGIHPQWHFYREVYERQPWTNPPHIDIRLLYNQRARQLREKYDYISLAFSGGSDSYTVLKAFESSGTHIDEVFVRWPIEATSRYSVSYNRTCSNILSEWQLTILPQIKEFRKSMPKTQFTIIDWSDRILTEEITDEYWSEIQNFFNPASRLKLDIITDATKQAINANKTVAVIYGVDKPQMCYRDGNIYCYFLDKLAHTHAHGDWGRYSELFFWTPDMPEIVPAQARLIYEHMRVNPAMIDLIDWTKPFDAEKKNIWNNIVRSLVYPDFDDKFWFQADKPSSSVFNEVDAWLYNDHRDSKFIQSWHSATSNYFASVDSKFIEQKNNQITGVVGFIDGMYLVGPAPVSVA